MNITKTSLTIVFYMLVIVTVYAQSKGSFIDSRDGKKYKTVTYKITKDKSTDSITWMAENLNFYTEDSFCSKGSNCLKHGRLYTWFEAKKVCPIGWHLPSDKEWNQLADLYGGLNVAGKHLKSKGSNKSSFDGLLGGMRDAQEGIISRLETEGFFWSATESPNVPDEASDWSFASWSDKLRH